MMRTARGSRLRMISATRPSASAASGTELGAVEVEQHVVAHGHAGGARALVDHDDIGTLDVHRAAHRAGDRAAILLNRDAARAGGGLFHRDITGRGLLRGGDVDRQQQRGAEGGAPCRDGHLDLLRSVPNVQTPAAAERRWIAVV
jgi:hypothetical protein